MFPAVNAPQAIDQKNVHCKNEFQRRQLTAKADHCAGLTNVNFWFGWRNSSFLEEKFGQFLSEIQMSGFWLKFGKNWWNWWFFNKIDHILTVLLQLRHLSFQTLVT
jgi:hypothetical protein